MSASMASVEKSGLQLLASKTVGQFTPTPPLANAGLPSTLGRDGEAGRCLEVADRVEVGVVEMEEQVGDADRVGDRLGAGTACRRRTHRAS